MRLDFSEYKTLIPKLIRKNFLVVSLNLGLLLSVFLYIFFSINNLPTNIPLFYNMPWGLDQLGNKSSLWLPFGLGLTIFISNFILALKEEKSSNYFTIKLYLYCSLLMNILLGLYIFRIISISSYIDFTFPTYIKLIVFPGLLAFGATALVTPWVIRFAVNNNYVDDPLTHKHPGMLLKKPTPRAGGLAYLLGILIPGIFLLPIFTSQKIIGILLGAIICVFIGLKDDRKDISPYVRFGTQILVAAIIAFAGILLIYIPNPFGNAIKLDNFVYVIDFLGEHKVFYISVIVSMFWLLSTMNFMSWSNGTDGVYAGLVCISSLVMSILMLDSLPVDNNMAMFIRLAALSAGAGAGMAIFTWPPQKLLWGFGATSAGLIIAALSIVGSTKVATAMLVLLIPFLDGAFAIVRRIRRGQMPFWGDREHLHHKLLEGFGWSKQNVAVFYWITTALLGLVGILTSGQVRALSIATITIIGIGGISLLNFLKRPKI